MKRKIFIGMASCILAMSMQAETVRVMRFVTTAGEESDVALNSLQKVVFTPDSVVLIAAEDGAQTPLYKYDYQSILFTESSSEGNEMVNGEWLMVNGEKFIKDGQLFIRHDEHVYTILGVKVL